MLPLKRFLRAWWVLPAALLGFSAAADDLPNRAEIERFRQRYELDLKVEDGWLGVCPSIRLWSM